MGAMKTMASGPLLLDLKAKPKQPVHSAEVDGPGRARSRGFGVDHGARTFGLYEKIEVFNTEIVAQEL